MIAEGLLSPYKTGTEAPPELNETALARIRQLSAHEVGHTLGLGHNYYDSTAGRISVMDYPHPLVTLKADGTIDFSKVYAAGIGEWDKVSIDLRLPGLPCRHDEPKALAGILDDAWAKDLRYLTNQDIDANPRVDQWSNGTDAADELDRMMEIRRVALVALRRERHQARRADGDSSRRCSCRSTCTTATRSRRRRPWSAASTTSTRCAATAACRSRGRRRPSSARR